MKVGYTLDPEAPGYDDLETAGHVRIDSGRSGVRIYVHGFDFNNLGNCRQQTIKALAWARDVLSAAIENSRLIPGGDLTVIADTPPNEFEPGGKS